MPTPDDPSSDVRLTLATRVADKVDRISESTVFLGGAVAGLVKGQDEIKALQALDHDALAVCVSSLGDLRATSTKTSDGIHTLALLAEKADKREDALHEASIATSESRWRFVSENWKLIAVLIAAVLAPSLLPSLLATMGAPVAPMVAPSPAPVAAPVALPALDEETP